MKKTKSKGFVKGLAALAVLLIIACGIYALINYADDSAADSGNGSLNDILDDPRVIAATYRDGSFSYVELPIGYTAVFPVGVHSGVSIIPAESRMETNFSWGYSEYYGVCWVTPTVYGSSGFDLSFYASDGAMYNLQGYTGSPDFSFSLPSVADDDSYITHDVLTWVVPSGIDLTGYDSVGSASFSWYASPDQYSDVALPDWLSEDDLENGTEFFVSSVPYGSYDLFFTLTDEAVYECSYTINVIEGSVPDLLLNPPEDSADGDSDNDPNLMYYTIAAIFAILLIGALVGYAMKGRK